MGCQDILTAKQEHALEGLLENFKRLATLSVVERCHIHRWRSTPERGSSENRDIGHDAAAADSERKTLALHHKQDYFGSVICMIAKFTSVNNLLSDIDSPDDQQTSDIAADDFGRFLTSPISWTFQPSIALSCIPLSYSGNRFQRQQQESATLAFLGPPTGWAFGCRYEGTLRSIMLQMMQVVEGLGL